MELYQFVLYICIAGFLGPIAMLIIVIADNAMKDVIICNYVDDKKTK